MATYQVLDALDEWFGRTLVGFIWFHMETSDIIEQSRLMLGDTIDEYRASFQKTMVKSISESSSDQRKGKQVKLASEIVQTLFACGFCWKLELGSRKEFRERMKAAIKVCCQNLSLRTRHTMKYSLSDHHDGQKFFNPNKSEEPGLWKSLKMLTSLRFTKWPEFVENKPVLNLNCELRSDQSAITFNGFDSVAGAKHSHRSGLV